MANNQTKKTVETLKHEDASRKNIPTAEYEPIMRQADKVPVRVAYERRNRDLDPQLVWRGKDEHDWSDLVVHAPPLYIQEKVHPKVLIDDLLRRSKTTEKGDSAQPDLFADFNGLPDGDAKTEFYQHDANWANRLADHIVKDKHFPFDIVVVDEAQDVSIAQLRFLAALGGTQPNGLFFTGDLGQRIFQQPFSWKALGVDIRGRSHTLRINYRTSHQIRQQADLLLGPEVSDVDGNSEKRSGTISVFNGPPPSILILNSQEEEIIVTGAWLSDRSKDGVKPHEFGVFVRSNAQLDRARQAVEAAGLPYKVLDEKVETISSYISISTMHLAKGLEFRAVVVMACDDEVIPLQERIESAADESDLEEVYNTERNLLYVACTRARDHLLVTSVDPASEFLEDLRM
ncbi:MAG: UvrD-helicase domain-containing protein [Acidobacteria bacterium]|nr:UvrD-helicase domain-containing protein [Acidobacteriota bacterium]